MNGSRLVWFALLAAIASIGGSVVTELDLGEWLVGLNTQRAIVGAVLLGVNGGVIGTLLLLRGRSLTADVLGHAAFPGVVVAFLVLERLAPGVGKLLPTLLTGAFCSGLLGLSAIDILGRQRRVRPDASLAVILGAAFGLGMVLLSVIQSLPEAGAAGLTDFVFGKAAALTIADVRRMAVLSSVILVVAIMLWKELILVCFDREFAEASGWPSMFLDRLLLGLTFLATLIGMQAVGMLLVVAVLITPAAAARFWTDRAGTMAFLASAIGAGGAVVGVTISAQYARAAAGPVMVLVLFVLFLISLLFGARRGIVWDLLRQRQQRLDRDRLDFLRSCYDRIVARLEEGDVLADVPLKPELWADQQRWSQPQILANMAQFFAKGWLRLDSQGAYRLTDSGTLRAQDAVRRHRLWELYLLDHAQFADHYVGAGADALEHLDDPQIDAELLRLAARYGNEALTLPRPKPSSPKPSPQGGPP